MFDITFMIACSKSESQVCKDTCDQAKMVSDTITTEYQKKNVLDNKKGERLPTFSNAHSIE